MSSFVINTSCQDLAFSEILYNIIRHQTKYTISSLYPKTHSSSGVLNYKQVPLITNHTGICQDECLDHMYPIEPEIKDSIM